LGDYKKFVSFYNQNKNKVVAEFVEYAKEQGIDKNKKSFKRSKQRIEDRLRAQIARNIWDDAAFYPLWNENDKTIKEALKILENPSKIAILETAN
jgi:carboxyl-terminal processing protease